MATVPIRIAIVLGTRPEAIKLVPVIKAFQDADFCSAQIILTGQHREMVAQVMDFFHLTADHDLAIMQHGQTLTQITCRSLDGLEAYFKANRPDLVLVQGDTTTAFAAALAAFYQLIPVGHVEAGLRTDDLFNPYPEEANRRLISQIAQLHFAPTTLSAENVRRFGVTTGIHQTGNTVIDTLLMVAATQPECPIPNFNWDQHRTILATVHRRENWGQPLQEIGKGFLQILEQFPDTALVLPLHRNPTVRDPLMQLLGNHPRAFLTEPLDYTDLVGAIQRSYLLMTDSGGLQEEAPSLGKPVLVLRDTTERPEAVYAGTAKLIGTNAVHIAAAAAELLTDQTLYDRMATAVNPFGDGHASERIVEIVRSYFGV